MAKAFLIVDIQNDFQPGGALPIKEGDEIIPIINELAEKFSHVIATKDWHPECHISFAERHKKKPGDIIEIEGHPQELWPAHCVQNTYGAEFPASLKTSGIEKVFYKGVDEGLDSYSAFFDNSHRRSTGLSEYLRQQKIETVYLAGVATDYCVHFSALDARALGFETYVILDACRGIDLKPGDIERAIDEMKQLGAVMITSDKLLSCEFYS